MRIDELRDTLHERAEDVADGVGVQARNEAVTRRVGTLHARRRAGVTASVALVVVAAVGAVVAVPPLLPERAQQIAPPDEPMVQTPPKLAGWVMPAKLRVRKVAYRYQRGEQTHDTRNPLRVAVPPTPSGLVIGWSTTPGTPGQVVVSVDGTEVRRSPAGSFEYGVALAPDFTHLVVVHATRQRPGDRIGLAIFERDTGF